MKTSKFILFYSLQHFSAISLVKMPFTFSHNTVCFLSSIYIDIFLFHLFPAEHFLKLSICVQLWFWFFTDMNRTKNHEVHRPPLFVYMCCLLLCIILFSDLDYWITDYWIMLLTSHRGEWEIRRVQTNREIFTFRSLRWPQRSMSGPTYLPGVEPTK